MNKLCVLQNLSTVEKDPWPHIIIENCLPEEIHNELIETLPNERLDQQESRDHHGKKSWKVKDIINERKPISNIWQDFIEYHVSKEFFEKVLDAFEPWSKNLVIKKQNINLMDHYKATGGNCYCDFNFVKHPPENNISNRTPHTDNEKEIYAGLLYLKYPDDKSVGGDFCLHKANDLKMTKHRAYLTPGPIVKKCEYKSNNFVMFWNGIDTQHSVSPRQNASHPRWSINMIGRFTSTKNWQRPN